MSVENDVVVNTLNY